MKRIWLVRHGESKAQTEEEFSLDSNLSDFGIQQSKCLHNILSDVDFDEIYLSPLRRARQTFEYSDIRKNNISFDSRLIEELPKGMYSTLLPYEKLPEYGKSDTYEAWEVNAQDRIKEFYEDISLSNATNILVVAHGGTLSMLLNLFLSSCRNSVKDAYYKYNSMGNTSISLFEMSQPEGNNKVVFWNFKEHLDGNDSLPVDLK